jgi:hypothetical protein
MKTSFCFASAWSFCLLMGASEGMTQTAEPTIKSAMRTPELVPLKYLAQQIQEDFAVTDTAGVAGKKIPLNIASMANASGEDLFEITGVPEEATLTAGERYNDFWLLRRKDMASLAIVTPEGFSQKTTLAITRTGLADRPPFTRSLTINFSAGTAAGNASEGLPEAPRVPAGYARSQNEAIQFEKAYEKFKEGDVAGARAIFEFLAAKGDAGAAVAMGETFDPMVLQQLYIKGLTPDAAAAAAWYQKAQQLGDAKARVRLNALNKN